MRFISPAKPAEATVFGFLFSHQEGHKRVLMVGFWKWEFAVEFGEGDSYDWEW